MGGDVRHPVRLGDPALRVDQVGPPLRVLGRRLLRGSLRLVAFAHRPVDVGEQPEREPVLLGEGPVVLGPVERDAHDLHAELLELGGSVTEPLALDRSTGGEGLGEPPQGQPPAPEVRQRDGLAILVGQGELGGRRSFGKHAGAPPRWTGGVYCGTPGIRPRRSGTGRRAYPHSPSGRSVPVVFSSPSVTRRSASTTPGTTTMWPAASRGMCHRNPWRLPSSIIDSRSRPYSARSRNSTASSPHVAKKLYGARVAR